jgi:hypothetical protein
MTSVSWDTQEIAAAPAVTAPDGSEVRILCATGRGSMIRFKLPPWPGEGEAHTVNGTWKATDRHQTLPFRLGTISIGIVCGFIVLLPPHTQPFNFNMGFAADSEQRADPEKRALAEKASGGP